MPHNTHTTSSRNKDVETTIEQARDYYLGLLESVNYEPSFHLPGVKSVDDKFVFDDSTIGVGSKCRFGEALVQSLAQRGVKRLVYVQPRFGFAGISLTWLCDKYGLDLTLFMPSSKVVSQHQSWCIEHGCDARFVRIAAMPNMNKLARAWASEQGFEFIPLGLKHPLVTAAVVATCIRLSENHQVSEMWNAISTGVLSRGLQIGFPDAEHHSVAVARNIKEGERGVATIYSHPDPFPKMSKYPCPFDCADNYDRKAYEFFAETASPGAYFWNVAGNLQNDILEDVDSFREWGDHRDLNR